MTDSIPADAVEAGRSAWDAMDPDDVCPHDGGQACSCARCTVVRILTAAAPHIEAGIALRIEREVYGEQGGINEPHPTIDDLIDWAARDRLDATDHAECPHYCNLCGEQLAKTRCPECYGSGCLPNAAFAIRECGECGGDGWIHDGCAEKTYAELAADNRDLRAGIEALRDEWRTRAAEHHTNAVSPDFTGTVNAVLGGMAMSHAAALDALLREEE